jgi:hypothetical protein
VIESGSSTNPDIRQAANLAGGREVIARMIKLATLALITAVALTGAAPAGAHERGFLVDGPFSVRLMEEEGIGWDVVARPRL